MGLLSAIRDYLTMPLVAEQRALTPAQAWAADIEWSGAGDAGVSVTQKNSTSLATVYACTTLIAEMVATLPVDVYYKRNGYPVPWRPRFAWLDAPMPDNPAMTRAAHFTQVVLSLLFDGNAFIHVSPAVQAASDRDALVTLTVLDPRAVYIAGDGRSPRYRIGGREYTPREVVHIPRTVRPGQLRGMSPIEEAAQTLGVAMAAQKHSARFYRNGTLLSTIIKVPGEMAEADALALRDGFEKAHTGDNVFRTGVLTGGADAMTLAVTPEQAQFLETARFHVVEVCRLFRTPPMLVGVNEPGAVSYASSQEAVRAFHVNTLAPLLTVLQQAYSRLTPPGTYLQFDTKGLLRADAEARYQAYATGLEKGMFTRNEVRGWEELPPIEGEGGDIYTVQAQMVTLESIANPPEPPPAPEGGGSAPPFEGRHLAGQHDQKTHGHGSAGSSRAAELQAKAKEVFGVTDDLSEAGYVTPDGTMLDFTGRHYSTGYHREGDRFVPNRGQPDYLGGLRNVDHREVSDLFPDDYSGQGNEGRMRTLVNEGFVRVSASTGRAPVGQPQLDLFPGSAGLEIHRPLTDSQLSVLSRQVRKYQTLTVDIVDTTGRTVALVDNWDRPATSNGSVLRMANEAAISLMEGGPVRAWYEDAHRRHVDELEARHPGHSPQSVHAGKGNIALADQGVAGGFTASRYGDVPADGIMVSPYKGREKTFPASRLDAGDIREYKRRNADVLSKPNHFIGGWKDGDTVYLDVSVRATSRAEALKLAKANDQLAVYDLTTKQTIPTPDLAA